MKKHLKKIRNASWARGWPVLTGIAVFAAVGTAALIISQAATAVTIDASLPVPQNVRAYPDDRNIIVTWGEDWDQTIDKKIVGYYITYRPRGSNEPYKVRQQQVQRGLRGIGDSVDFKTGIQLQPLPNGVEYEINIQSATGTWISKNNGNLTHNGNEWASRYPVADGKVSEKVTVYATTSSARVDDMRQRLTGFFDDFNTPAGAFDELKWNTATTACIEPGTAAAFINDQFHSHNQIRSSCDRAGIVSRPRGVFDITNATEANPAVIQFDVDGASQPRDTWYLDIIPLSARSNSMPLDVTGHNDLFDADSQDPGNMVRINSRYDSMSFAYYATNRSPAGLNDTNANGMPAASMRSPLPVPNLPATAIPNVRNHWLVEITPTKMRIIVNGQTVTVKSLPSEFTSQKKFTLHSTIFSYNTGKQYDQVTPYVQMLHWDNFGFSGPVQTEETHNYLEGGPSGNTPVFSTSTGGSFSIGDAPRTTIIPVPDPLGNPVNDKGYLYFTLQNTSSGTWTWTSNDHILVNGKRYNLPDPSTTVRSPYSLGGCDQYSSPYVAHAQAIAINKADLIQGNNTVTFNINGKNNDCAGRAPTAFNVHLELPYSKAGSIPSYTSPTQIFSDKYLAITKPPITTCDQYWFVERDLGLPYEAGKGNLVTGPCTLMDGHTVTTTPGEPHPAPTPPANQAPTVTLSASAINTTAPASFSLAATAADGDGTVTKLEIKQGGSTLKTCASSNCTQNVSSLGAGTYTYTAVATDNSGATTTSSQVTVTVSEPTPPPTSNKFTTLAVNASLPSESECATRVKPAIETRPANQMPNNTKGTGGNYDNSRVTGNYTGTTDEIIQWAACKWGMDEDILRAQMVQESYWHQSAIGDFTSGGASLCSPVYPPGNYPAQYNGDSAHNNQCPESYGLAQVRWTYHKSAFYKSTSETTANLTNNAIYSTAYNVDYWASVWRRCYNGEYTWLNTVEKGRNYAAGDEWGCLGMWFSGRWYTNPATTYISNVQNNLNSRVWETTAFKNAQPVNTIPSQNPAAPPADTTAPTVSITAPANNATVSGTVSVTATAADAVGVSRVSYFLDGSSTAFSNDSAAPFQSSWNTALVSNGSHTIIATAIDAAGNIGTSATITVNVQNTVPDTAKPTVSITSPSGGATVKDTIIVAVTAADNVGVSKVEFLVDGQVTATDLTSPYRFELNTAILSEGGHAFLARAYDAAGNNSYSAQVTVTVDNIVTPPPTCQDPAANNVGQPLPCTYPPAEPEVPAPTPVPGDVTGDGKLDRDDLRSFLYYYVRRTGSGDVDGDGVIDRDDLRSFLYYYVRKG